MNPVRLIEACLSETYSKVYIGKNLWCISYSGWWFFAFQLCFRICHQEGLKSDGMHQLLIYADDDSIVGENINIIKIIQKLCYRLLGRLV